MSVNLLFAHFVRCDKGLVVASEPCEIIRGASRGSVLRGLEPDSEGAELCYSTILTFCHPVATSIVSAVNEHIHRPAVIFLYVFV